MEDIRSWLDSVLENSRIRWEYMQTQDQDDPDGWGEIFAASLQEGASVVSGCGLLLTGADSYGKQSAAAQMLALLVNEAYEGVFLEGTELCDGGIRQAKARLDALLDCFYDAGKGLCLILEGLEDCPCRRELLNFLGQTLCVYRTRDDYTPFFLILLDDREQDIPGLLRGRLRLCRMCLPDLARREAYLKQNARSLRNFLSLEVFARATEGASYAQLQDMISVVGCLVDSRDVVTLPDAELTAFLAGQMPAPRPEDAMQTLCRSVQGLVDQLPELLKEAAAMRQTVPAVVSPVQTVPARAPMPVAVDQGSFMDSKRREIEQMTPWELAVDLFGEKGVGDLRNQTVMLQQ